MIDPPEPEPLPHPTPVPQPAPEPGPPPGEPPLPRPGDPVPLGARRFAPLARPTPHRLQQR